MTKLCESLHGRLVLAELQRLQSEAAYARALVVAITRARGKPTLRVVSNTVSP
jgi:hypothetical protein